MWGFGGRYYWGRKERGKVEGIVVVFAWMSSQDRYIKNYVDLYSSLGWKSLVCHSQFHYMFFPDKAAAMAAEIVNELVEELKVRPCPVVFASFSGGPKACMYKVLQIIEGKYEEHANLGEFRLVRDCLSGYIFDSSPVDFTSDLGTKFILHPTVLGMSRPPRLASWIVNGIASSMDALFLKRFESHRAEFWQTLYASVSTRAPYLILCSEDDDLAPCQTICNFAQRLKDLGSDVKLLKWSSSPHVGFTAFHNHVILMKLFYCDLRQPGHYRYHQHEYKAAVTELLGKAAMIYSQRIRQLEGEKMVLEGSHDGISEPLGNLRKAAATANQSFQSISLELNDHFLVPNSVEYHEGSNGGSVQHEQKERYIPLSSPPRINAHGVLGQVLFDVCVPKVVEDWDIRSSPTFRKASFPSTRRHSPFNPMKCIRRSRL
ncbi:hypothetical protein MTR67_020852 [Solanum verrucosum]|uniref:DUF829 domain-containing protein n=1 Tax=Solanum verrucosum TaxID=315347 RepID=A0AAF0QRG9_SOLVR|nr:hypothetical protein MTR67_020852 [Solanum verrucosum]